MCDVDYEAVKKFRAFIAESGRKNDETKQLLTRFLQEGW